MDDRSFMYEIFRACRLCGGGGGYKMPIVTNLPLDGSDIELRHKIRECVQIEVLEDDHMPPLICELCVDKINEYYDFLEMCRLTNRNTRIKLGLPMESTMSGAADEDDNCILGTEDTPVFTSDQKSETKVKQTKSKPGPKSATRGKPGLKPKDVKKAVTKPGPASKKRDISPAPELNTRSSRSSSTIDLTGNTPTRSQKEKGKGFQLVDDLPLKRMKKYDNDRESSNEDLSNTPTTRGSKDKCKTNSVEEPKRQKRQVTIEKDKSEQKPSKIQTETHNGLDKPNKNLQKSSHNSGTELPLFKEISKGIIKKELKVELDILKETPSTKTTRSKAESPPPTKKNKSSPKPVKAETPPPSKTKMAPSTFKCTVCKTTFKAQQYLNLHLAAHYVNFTLPKLACNACRDWFASPMEVADHHKWHDDGNSYSCKQCYDDFDTYPDFVKHIDTNKCIPLYEVSDIKCDDCWQLFPTLNLLNIHDCEGEMGRPGGKCYRCKKSCSTQKVLKKHEESCTYRPKLYGCYIDPKINNSLKAVTILTKRCDSLLKNKIKDHYDVSAVKDTFGLDKNTVYPFSRTVKRLPFNGMVNIGDEFFTMDDEFIHWDSDTDEENDVFTKKKIPTLFHLALKNIYSKKFLGKVPKKRKSIKTDIDKAQTLLDFLIADDENSALNDSGKNKCDNLNDNLKNGVCEDVTSDDNKDDLNSLVNKNADKFKIKSILSEKFENDEQNGVFDVLESSKTKVGI